LQENQSFFADVMKLTPAHTLSSSGNKCCHPRRYWSLPVDRRITYSETEDYPGRFRELLAAAVSDRLRTSQVSVSMSGGLDSTSVAAIAHRSGSAQVQAHTMIYQHLMPDPEKHFSAVAARYLEIPIRQHAMDGYCVYERWDQPGFLRPEPIN